MKISTRTWTDANDKMYRKSITITREDGIVETVEGKGKTLRDAKAEVDRMYIELMETELDKNTDVQIASQSSKVDKPNFREEKPRPIRISRFSDAPPKAAITNTLPDGSDPEVPQFPAEPLPIPHRQYNYRFQQQTLRNWQEMHQPIPNHRPSFSNPPTFQHYPRKLSYTPGTSLRGHQPGSVLSQRMNDKNGYGHRIPAHYRNGMPPRVHRASRIVVNNRGRRHRLKRQAPGNEDSWSDAVTASASSASKSFRSKKIKTDVSTSAKTLANGSYTSVHEEEEEDEEEIVFEVDDSGEDWVSKLNVIKDKIKYRFERRFDKIRYTSVESKKSKRSKGANRYWMCTLNIRDRKATEENATEEIEKPEDVFISVTKISNVKKEAKKLAAKYMIEKINDMLDEERANDGGRNSHAENAASITDFILSEENAISTIHTWWQKDLLEGKPDLIAKEVNGKPGEVLWESVYFVRVKGKDEELSFRERDTSKQAAKNKAALAAVKAIVDLNLPGFEDALEQRRKTMQRKVARREIEDMCPENTWEMVQLTDDEAERSEDPPLETNFTIPPNYEVCLAKSVEDCDSWTSRLLQNPMNVGVYVDSVYIREEMLQIAEKAGYDISKHDRKTIDCRVICLATQTSALLMNMEEFESASGKIEIPKCVRNLFENSEIRLLGMWPDWSKAALWKNYKLKCSTPIVDLSMDSFALSGVIHNGSRLHSIRSICDLWLKLAFQPFSTKAIQSVQGLQELVDSTDALVAPAVQAALVGPIVDKHFEQMAASREYQSYGHISGFKQIARRLTSTGVHGTGRREKVEDDGQNDNHGQTAS